MTIRLGSSDEYAELTVERLAGEAGLGRSKVLVHCTARLRAQETNARFEIAEFTGQLLLYGADGQLWPVARLFPRDTAIVLESEMRPAKRGFVMEAELDKAVLDAVELQRAGKDMRLDVRINANVLFQGRRSTHGGSEVVELVAGQWLAILATSGHQKTLVVEIPLDANGKRRTSKPMKHLVAAQEALYRGDTRGSVALCRDVIESIPPLLAAQSADASEKDKRQWSKERRLDELAAALKLLPHAAKHDKSNEQEIVWTRYDAEMMLAMVASLVRWHARS